MDRRWLPIAVAVVVLAASLVPGGGGGGTIGPVGVDKLLHVVGYAVLAAASLFALRSRTGRAMLAVGVVVTAFGGGVELLQGFVPGRGVSGLDLVADAVGAVAGVAAWRVFGPSSPPEDAGS
ncbi:VanZ family protein [Halolamina sediminis]|uniref:VanZ family protein n=1 Tax=Halolamina sediminis TaxID=1480675 RepID=UPI0006B5C17B|nr:VanZ family protein [Halolamina sediminis]